MHVIIYVIYTKSLCLGNLAGELRRTKCTTELFISLKTLLVPMWERQRKIWEEIIEKLPVQKYKHSEYSEHHKLKAVTLLKDQKMTEWFGLQKCFMPLPNSVMAFPMWRYVPF